VYNHPCRFACPNCQCEHAEFYSSRSPQPRSETTRQPPPGTRVQNEPGSTGTFQILVGKHDQKFQPFREPKRATRKATKVFSETDPLLCPSAAARWPRAHETPERVSSGVFPAAASFAASCVRPCASGCHRRHAGRHENVRARDLPVASELLPPFISARSAAAGASARLSPSSPLESPSRSHISVTRHCRRCQAHFCFF
jgi:hypothetical protein